MKAPTEDLTREASFTVVRADEDDDGLTLEGYGAVFNAPTVIDSWEGRFEERISPGAFKRTIDRKGPRGIRLQFDHGQHPLIGSIPIGAITDLSEDSRGLKVAARLHDNWLIEPVRDAIRDGSVTGMSFRFRVVREEWDETDPEMPVRTLRELELFEVGPVVWPAYEETSVGVRAQQIARELMDPEQRAAVARALLAGTSSEPDATSDGPTREAPSDPQADGRHEPASPSDTQQPSDDRALTRRPGRATRPRTSKVERLDVARKVRQAALTAKEQAHA